MQEIFSMPSLLNKIKRLLVLMGVPIRKCPLFFSFMYLLGALCIWCTSDRVYTSFFIKLFLELFFDVYVLSLVLSFFPKNWKNILAGLIAMLLYLVAIVDLFCIVRLSSPISPSIIRLIAETNSQETSEFINAYINSDIIWSPVGAVVLLCIMHIAATCELHRKQLHAIKSPAIAGIIVCGLLVCGLLASLKNKKYIIDVWQLDSIGKVEKYFGNNFFASRAFYLPVYRLAFAIHANRLTAGEIRELLEAGSRATVQSCSYSSPTIVLIIGESYNKHHSQLYGYSLPTTPNQKRRQEEGELVVIRDAVTPYNLTGDVLKNAFSLNNLSEGESWSEKPLFTQYFKKAGYDVTFLSNFFVIKEQKDFADFSGGFFLNDVRLSTTQFNRRNVGTHRFDEQLLDDYQHLTAVDKLHRLVIFTLTGQHVDYKDRFPSTWKRFNPQDYHRPGLQPKELQVVADYDNATLYNDYIVERIIRLFENDDAVILYLADHGEEVYDEIRIFGRQHNEDIPKAMAKNEFQVPFWIWTSPSYREHHPILQEQIQTAASKPFFSDDLSQVTLYLGGIECVDYRDSLNILSNGYDANRKRQLRGKIDYDKLMRKP